MKRSFVTMNPMVWMLFCMMSIAAGCGGSAGVEAEPVVIGAGTPNAVSAWNEAATTTVNQPNAAAGTPEEMQSVYAVDLASVHVAMYDAAVAIAGGHQPFYVTPRARADGASPEAAIAAAAYGVLRGLFPSRAAFYQPVYDAQLAALPDGDAKQQGLALGAEVAAGVLAARANDGRMTPLAPFVAGTGPGQFRGPALVGRSYPFIRPFALDAAAQFRPAGAPALVSAQYAADYAETRALGGSASTSRSAEQATAARFHSEPPSAFWPRNLRRFVMTERPLAEQARLGALLWVTHADATIACFEAKYHFLAWRPFSAINLGDTDGNDATAADAAWTPLLPTPPHPEYPAAHACVAAAVAQALRLHFGTARVSYDFDSKASASTQHYADVEALLTDVTTARIAGGMHFRSALVDGAVLGRGVAAWTSNRRFQSR
ncbi:vanadium-dependent haloperoxidase [Roseateles sp.]|uniref:vanadium-dependent haloperoxidase n=1 Tax=Roseateles sp. TaxID=1971397 RepID=UPI0025E9C427|nr:vanadium-dependent haloperoxidase [Roseateles sp.]MBV8034205.1 vanadium-dependent haloperoxidase [Roseateles sp.]